IYLYYTFVTGINPAFMRKILFLLMMLSAIDGFAQEDTLFRRNSFIPLPVFGYSPEKGFEFGAGLYYSFFTDKADPIPRTRNSTVRVSGTFSTENQYKLDLKADIWTPGNNWHFQPQVRYHDSPFNFYGLGDTSLNSLRSRVNNVQYKVSLIVERQLLRNFYGGISFLYQKDEFSSRDNQGIYPEIPLVDKTGGHATFLGISAVYDNRDNQNYTRFGGLLRLGVNYTPPVWSKREITTITLDGRYFWTLSPKLTVGANTVYSTLQGEKRPFYFLPSMGSDQIMRGYQGGRYRDQSFFAAQTELRYFIDPGFRIRLPFLDDTPTFALAVFGGGGSVFRNGNVDPGRLKPNYGLGIRYFYDEVSRLTLRLDYGWGEQRAGEPRQGALYLSVGEAF
ncbi:MAG TPA: hypothetical protein VIR29_11380, partial [Anseongella sp.]